MDCLHRARRPVIGDEAAIIEKRLDHSPGVPGQGITQAGFQPPGQAVESFLGDARGNLREEGFGFAVAFAEAFFAKFFLASLSGFCLDRSAARR
jgi:hypothetical protein